MKHFIPIALLMTAAIAYSCCKKNQNQEEAVPEEDVIVSANINPDNPSIASIQTINGDEIYIFGQKNENGQAVGLTDVIIKPASAENATEIYFNEDHSVSEIICDNGVKMIFDWLDKMTASVTLIDPNTEEQLNTLVCFDGKDETVATTKFTSSSIQTRRGAASIGLRPISSSYMGPRKAPQTKSVGSFTGNVWLKQCDTESDAECWVDVYDFSDNTYAYGRGKFRGRFRCNRVSKGHYTYTLPDYAASHEHYNLADYCDGISDIMGYICEANEALGPMNKQYLCAAISAAMIGGIVSAPVAAIFEAACAGTSIALDLYCGTLGFGAGFGGPSISDGLCGVVREMNITWDTPLYIVPVVNALPKSIIGFGKKNEVGQTPPDLYVSWGGEPTITNFYLEPSAPVEGQDYDAIATLYCLPALTTVTMDIVGTDGYTDSKTITTGTEITYEATLHVPGAASGVYDVCTVTIKTLEGVVKTKKASLVFH